MQRIDFDPTPEHADIVLKAVLHCLLLLAFIGLSDQGVAAAATPCAEMARQQAAAMASMPDCHPDAYKSVKDSTPCQDMTPACMAMAGCAALTALGGGYLPLADTTAATSFWQVTPVLHGRTVSPDPDPPSRLG